MNQQPTTSNQQLKIEAFILCWNEEKMIRHTLNHYSQFCSQITIIDNCSNDRTLSIIETEYPTVKVIQYESNNQIRDDAYMHIKNTVWKNSTADWAIVCDMDELLYHPDLIKQLTDAKEQGVGIMRVEGYNMCSNFFPEDYTKPITDQIKKGVRATNFDKSIVFCPQIIEETLYGTGAHTCNPIYKPGKQKVNSPNTLKLLHYKYLGYDYLLEKHKQYAARLSDYNKKNNFGAEYINYQKQVRECFEILEKSKLVNTVI